MNLLENAVKHAKGMENLFLRITAEGSNVLFEVEDDGMGFVEKRVGIGLTVCETIVKAHDGLFDMKHNKTGGTVASFTLDMEEENDEQ